MGRQMRFGVGSVVVVVAMLVWSGSALAAVKTTVTFTGGSPAISGALPVQSYAWGIHGGSGTGGSSGHTQFRSPSVSFSQLSVTMQTNKQTTLLAHAVTGGGYPTVTLDSVQPPAASAYQRIILSHVLVEDVSVGTTGDQSTPVLRVTFEFQSAQVLYAAESSCSLAAKSWSNYSQVTPAVDPAGGLAADVLDEFLPIQVGSAGPGAVEVADPALADTLLGGEGANGLKNLRAQTLATRLNVSAGAIDPAVVETELDQADALVGAHVPGSWARLDPATQTQVNQLVSDLKSTNVPAAGCPAVPQVARLTDPGTGTFALAGVATDTCTGAPIHQLQVTVNSSINPGPVQLPVSHSQFGIGSLAAGTYVLTVSGDGYSTVTLPAVQIPPAQGSPLAGGFADGSQIAIGLAPLAGCRPGARDPGPVQLPAVSGQILDKCTLAALTGGTANLVTPAGSQLPTAINGNLFTLDDLAAGGYGLDEQVSGYQPVLYTGPTLPAVQMPAQPAAFADGSAARFGLIIVVEPQPAGAAC